jgi:hypothetical protein
MNLAKIVQTGRDFTGNLVGQNPDERLQIINNASQILYGFDIISPCEDISEDTTGNVIIVPKSPPFNSDCLYYLWTNTGKEFDRGVIDQNGTADKRRIGNTYVTIGQRFSGLKKNEGPTQLLKDHPFRTCQLTGSLSPVKPNGQVNQDGVNYANSIGSVLDIQNNYNAIFTAANKPGSMGDDQTAAVKQCYGLNKSVRTLSAQANALDLTRIVGSAQLLLDPRALKTTIPEGTKVALRINSLYAEAAGAPSAAYGNPNHPVWQSQNYWYLSYNSDGKALWTKKYNLPQNIFTISYPPTNILPPANISNDKYTPTPYSPANASFMLQNMTGNWLTNQGNFKTPEFINTPWRVPKQVFSWAIQTGKANTGGGAPPSFPFLAGPVNVAGNGCWFVNLSPANADFAVGDGIVPYGPMASLMDIIPINSMGVVQVPIKE